MSARTIIEPGFALRQTEFPLAVAICAWCKPKRGASTLGVWSHGICPRHLRVMKSKLKSGAPLTM